jgi:desulfoferrodoxin-like iron-binding protein
LNSAAVLLEGPTVCDSLCEEWKEKKIPHNLARSPCFIGSGDGISRANSQRRRTMGKKGEIFKCDICEQVVEVMEPGDGELVCCGEPMVQHIGFYERVPHQKKPKP